MLANVASLQLSFGATNGRLQRKGKTTNILKQTKPQRMDTEQFQHSYLSNKRNQRDKQLCPNYEIATQDGVSPKNPPLPRKKKDILFFTDISLNPSAKVTWIVATWKNNNGSITHISKRMAKQNAVVIDSLSKKQSRIYDTYLYRFKWHKTKQSSARFPFKPT